MFYPGGHCLHPKRQVGCSLDEVLHEEVVRALLELTKRLEKSVHAEALRAGHLDIRINASGLWKPRFPVRVVQELWIEALTFRVSSASLLA